MQNLYTSDLRQAKVKVGVAMGMVVAIRVAENQHQGVVDLPQVGGALLPVGGDRLPEGDDRLPEEDDPLHLTMEERCVVCVNAVSPY